jgi:hypothetical protein
VPKDRRYALGCPRYLDTDAYTDRDRLMFWSGEEFGEVLGRIIGEDGPISRMIYRENESRVRMACGRYGRRCTIRACASGDPAGLWSYLEIEARWPA